MKRRTPVDIFRPPHPVMGELGTAAQSFRLGADDSIRHTGRRTDRQYPEYSRRRAAGGMGLLITESTLIPEPSTALDLDMVSFFRAEATAAWKAVVDAVHAEGAVSLCAIGGV